MRVAGVLEVLAEDIHKPQFGVVLHEAEVVIRKLLELLVNMVADIARVPEHLSQDRMHFHLHLPLPEYLTASLKRPQVRRHQHHIDLFILQGRLRLLALLDSLVSDCAVYEVLGV